MADLHLTGQFKQFLLQEVHQVPSIIQSTGRNSNWHRLHWLLLVPFKKMFGYPSKRESHSMYPIYALNNSGGHKG